MAYDGTNALNKNKIYSNNMNNANIHHKFLTGFENGFSGENISLSIFVNSNLPLRKHLSASENKIYDILNYLISKIVKLVFTTQ